MKIKTSWAFGNFDISAEAEVVTAEPVGPVAQALLEKGLLQLLQRSPASEAEKALAGHTWPKGEKSGKPLRPKKFNRSSIEFTEANATKLRGAFGTEVEVAEGVKLPFVITSVTEHVGGESGPTRVMATALLAKVRENSGMALVAGVDLTAPEETQIEQCHVFLRGLVKKAAPAQAPAATVEETNEDEDSETTEP